MNISEPKTTKSAGINVGSASLVMVFAILSLTVFAVLSAVSANNELKLAEKFAASIENYYSADYIACDIIDEIKTKVENNEPVLVDNVFFEDNKGYFEVPIDAGQNLRVAIEIQNSQVTVLSWQVVNILEQNYDNSLNVWTGE